MRVPLFNFNRMYDDMAKRAGLENVKVRCRHCGAEQDVKGAYCIAHGWPECHGETMRLVKDK